MILAILLILIGLAVLIFGAEILVRGSSSLAKKMGIPALVIGLTIVAFGTSAPELVVNIFSALKGSTDLAIGNVIGSNIANILLILGISAIIFPLAVKSSTVWKEIPFALLAVLMVFVLGNDILIDGSANSILSRIDGLVLLGFFAVFMFYIVSLARAGKNDDEVKTYSNWLAVLMTFGGLTALFFGGKMLVDNAIILAQMAGMSQSLIGLTIVAVGTSLPELVTSVVAALHKQSDIAVGNIVGSNIFNLFFILGTTATILPLPFNNAINFDVLFCLAVTTVLFLAMFVGSKRKLDRWQGVMFILTYVAYVAYLVFRG